jgi:hypothetical protein
LTVRISLIRRFAPAVALAGLLVVAAPLAAAAPPAAADNTGTGSPAGSDFSVGSRGAITQNQATDRHEAPKMPYYATCADVWAAGKAPLYAGEPGYRADLDPDATGIACAPAAGKR